ncbi:uncharacterized protein LOC116112655 [Pistacia vera]|uniref:uncharacterized protein LOC116112655 n=1 Tax=Pistacia vera TaxID=55513 RepID=UPI001263461C|nr:uncharacterized protein LOC116112655 [Pistacia vera]
MAPKLVHYSFNSLPSRSHPVTSNVEEHLNSLKASEATSTVCNNLNALEDLYERVDDMLQLPPSNRFYPIIAGQMHRECVGIPQGVGCVYSAKDILSQLKESVQNFESSLRRKERSRPC